MQVCEQACCNVVCTGFTCQSDVCTLAKHGRLQYCRTHETHLHLFAVPYGSTSADKRYMQHQTLSVFGIASSIVGRQGACMHGRSAHAPWSEERCNAADLYTAAIIMYSSGSAQLSGLLGFSKERGCSLAKAASITEQSRMHMAAIKRTWLAGADMSLQPLPFYSATDG